ncbi:hypothetical protein DL89DRAFT_280294 [Linderina pennispora]|uniref:DDE Tnp4 domain-containing protein n=1 Tax=Linderina pennispora TaxID=61395 RepID=A0A1Y1WJI4_9FUNG|nr:uncharacterized protein DL89DRAFT_280294 [Linderina pennispora]ORX73740.1 hypothetical protein DL89DRAFT_280294 [Linderina pennispora]
MAEYTLDQQIYIHRALAEISPYTRGFLPFHDEQAFMKTTRMSVLKFLRLVDLLKSHRLLAVDDIRDAALQIAFTLFRLCSTHSISIAAEKFQILPAQGRKYTVRVVQAIVDTLQHLISFPDPVSSQARQSALRFKDRAGYLGAGNIWLSYKPEYQRELFLCRDEGSEGNPGIRILAAVSDECRFMYLFVECPASYSYKEVMCASPLYQNQGSFLKEKAQISPRPYLENQYMMDAPHGQTALNVPCPPHVSAVMAVGNTFSMWKRVFPSLIQLPLLIRSHSSLQSCKSPAPCMSNDWVSWMPCTIAKAAQAALRLILVIRLAPSPVPAPPAATHSHMQTVHCRNCKGCLVGVSRLAVRQARHAVQLAHISPTHIRKMQFADSPEDRAYIDLCLSGLSDDTKNLLPFGNPDAFMQLVRMSPLMFFKLVELLEPHKAFHGRMSKQREVAFQVALILIRLGSTTDKINTMAKRYKISMVTIGMLEHRVVTAILDKMKSYATWPKNPTDVVRATRQQGAPTHNMNRVGYLAAGKIYLSYAPSYRKAEFVAEEDKGQIRNGYFSIRVLAVISPTTNRFLHFFAGKPGFSLQQ